MGKFLSFLLFSSRASAITIGKESLQTAQRRFKAVGWERAQHSQNNTHRAHIEPCSQTPFMG